MVSVVPVMPSVDGPAVRAPPMLPSAGLCRRGYKAGQHCEGSEHYGKTLDIESHGFSCLLINTAKSRPREQDASERWEFRGWRDESYNPGRSAGDSAFRDEARNLVGLKPGAWIVARQDG
jgi:hypothetical protein